jgi:ribosome-associated heat shock protein Hsp15
MSAPADPRDRLDKWLWAARFYKTRALAAEAAEAGRVLVSGQPARPGRELRVGELLELRLPGLPPRQVKVLALSRTRGPASVARTLYEETAASLEAQVRAAEARRLAPEPAAARLQGRPTKRERRALDQTGPRWNRWSASVDDD